jgi:hypothetical protein
MDSRRTVVASPIFCGAPGGEGNASNSHGKPIIIDCVAAFGPVQGLEGLHERFWEEQTSISLNTTF